MHLTDSTIEMQGFYLFLKKYQKRFISYYPINYTIKLITKNKLKIQTEKLQYQLHHFSQPSSLRRVLID